MGFAYDIGLEKREFFNKELLDMKYYTDNKSDFVKLKERVESLENIILYNDDIKIKIIKVKDE